MADPVTDPDLLAKLEGTAPPRVAAPTAAASPVTDPDLIARLEAQDANPPEKLPAPSGLSEDEFLRWVEERGKGGKWIDGAYHSPITDEDFSRYSKIKAGRARGAESYQDEDGLTHAARSYLHGATFGWGPQLTGFLAKHLYGYDPTEVTAEENQKAAQFGSDHPTANFLSGLAGGIPSIAIGGEAVSAAPYVGPAVDSALSYLGNPWFRSAGIGLASGIPIGISQEVANRGLTPGAVAVGAAKGGGEGMVLGPASYGVLRGGLGLYRGVRDAIWPMEASLRKTAEELDRTGVTVDQIRNEVMPDTSSNLRARGFTPEIMTDIVSRGLRGEPAAQIASDYAHLTDSQGRSLTAQTVQNYVSRYRDMHPTPLNVVDVTKQLAGEGGAEPVTRLARAASGISGSPVAAQRLQGRQLEQPGRAVNIIERANPGAQDYETTIDRLNHQAAAEANRNYTALHQQPDVVVNEDLGRLLASPLARAQWEKARVLAESEGQEIPTYDELARTFGIRPRGGLGLNPETGVQEPPAQYPQLLGPTLPPNAAAAAQPSAGLPPAPAAVVPVRALDYFQRALRLSGDSSMNSDAATGIALHNTRRRLLDILDPAAPPAGQQPTQPTLVPGFRQTLASYRTGRAGPEAMEAGRAMTTKLGAPVNRETLREFDRMTPAQRQLFRIGFAQSLIDKVGDRRFGADAVSQFDTPNTQAMIRRIWPDNEAPGIAERLIHELQTEGITTRTRNDILAGSRTAPMKSDMDHMMEGANMVADLATGNPLGLRKTLMKRLAYHIGRRQAGAIADVTSETDPANMLANLNEMSSLGAYNRGQQATMNMLSGYAGPNLTNSNPYDKGPQPSIRDSKPKTAREIAASVSPNAKLHYSPELGGLVVSP
jgi:hypothetical protein